MNLLLGIIQAILGFGFGMITLIFKMIVVVLVAIIALVKRRSPLLWGGIALFFPWIILVLLFMPRKYPKFPGHLNNAEAFRGKNPVIASIMALSAMVAKADGSISRDEISFLRKFISNQFGIVGEELDSYAGAFEYGKNHPDDYRAFTTIITGYYDRRDIILGIAYLLVSIAIQDGDMSENEDLQIRKILAELGLSEYEYSSIKNSFNQSSSYYSNQGTSSFVPNQEGLVKKYCEVLGVREDASMADIKKAYRKLVKAYHPDEMASKGMPKDYIDFANKKIIEINEAYEYLKNIKEA